MRRIEVTAYHEAGHAVAAWHYGLKFRSVTIIPDYDADSLGHVLHERFPTWFRPDAGASDQLRLHGERHIVVSFAGQIAEATFRGRRPWYGMHSDTQNAVDMAFRLCGGSKETVEAYLRYCWCLSSDLVIVRWREIQAVAQALLSRRTLTYEDVLEVIFPGTAALRASLEAGARATGPVPSVPAARGQSGQPRIEESKS